MDQQEDTLAFLLRLNLELAEKEVKGQSIMPPALPAMVVGPDVYFSEDCITSPAQ